MAETNIPQPLDVAGECLFYDVNMTRAFLADGKPEERSALRLLMIDLAMEIVGEAADWPAVLAEVPGSHADVLLIDWDLLPNAPATALKKLRRACPAALLIVLISQLDARGQAALSAGADAFISKGETPEQVIERLRSLTARFSVNVLP